jgi:hypothetical protein
MTTYTAIPDANLDPDSPARSIDALALRDNPIAITEGASGAPSILNAAFRSVAVGAVISWARPDEQATTDTAYPATGIADLPNSSIIRVYADGTVRIKGSHKTSNAGSNSSYRILKNGVLVIQHLTVSLTLIAQSDDVSVAFGDVIELQHHSSGGDTSTLSLLSIGGDAVVWVNSSRGY